jgi:hypothetical protein
MAKARVRVRHEICWNYYDFGIYDGRAELFELVRFKKWRTLEAATRNAKTMAKRIGIPFEPEIINKHGC